MLVSLLTLCNSSQTPYLSQAVFTRQQAQFWPVSKLVWLRIQSLQSSDLFHRCLKFSFNFSSTEELLHNSQPSKLRLPFCNRIWSFTSTRCSPQSNKTPATLSMPPMNLLLCKPWASLTLITPASTAQLPVFTFNPLWMSAPTRSATMQRQPLQLQSLETRVSLVVTWCKFCITVT